jgi:hypothetical protein
MGKKVNTTNRGFLLRGNKHQIKRMQDYMKETFGGDITVGKLSVLLGSFPQVRRETILAARV